MGVITLFDPGGVSVREKFVFVSKIIFELKVAQYLMEFNISGSVESDFMFVCDSTHVPSIV